MKIRNWIFYRTNYLTRSIKRNRTQLYKVFVTSTALRDACNKPVYVFVAPFPRKSLCNMSFVFHAPFINDVSTCFAKASLWDNYTIKFYRYYYVIIISTIIVILIIDSVIIFIFTGIIMYIIKKRNYSPYCFLPNAQVSETKRRAYSRMNTLKPDPVETG